MRWIEVKELLTKKEGKADGEVYNEDETGKGGSRGIRTINRWTRARTDAKMEDEGLDQRWEERMGFLQVKRRSNANKVMRFDNSKDLLLKKINN